MSDIINELVALRKLKGYTQRELAERTGVGHIHIAKIETKKLSPTIEIVSKLSSELGFELKLVEKRS